MSVTERKFGELPGGETVRLFHLETADGAYAEVLDLGAAVVKICVPDQEGALVDVVLGYDDVEGYYRNSNFYGFCIGRNANRIADGRFVIHGTAYQLARNTGLHSLHSGPDAFEKKIWNVEEISQEKNSVLFSRLSPDGENGFPGELRVSVKMEFTEEHELRITYHGVSDQATIVNLTNHSYFNLSGEGSGSILGQQLMLRAGYFTPVIDEAAIPTGEYAPVEGTPMDFRRMKPIGQDIEADFEQLAYGHGYDHNFMTDQYAKGNIRLIATAFSPDTGIAMDVTTDRPAVQFYTGNSIREETGKNGHTYGRRDGFCLETQVEPNSPNEERFHSSVLEKGEIYHTVTAYRFYVKNK